MIVLSIHYHDKAEKKKEFTKEKIFIGKLAKVVDISINEEKVSNKHTEIFKKDKSWNIRDLASKNGTFLNGNRLKPFENILLNNGDYITIGDSHLSVLIIEDKRRVKDRRAGVDKSGGRRGGEKKDSHKTPSNKIFDVFAMTVVFVLSSIIFYLITKEDTREIQINIPKDAFVNKTKQQEIIKSVNVTKVEFIPLTLETILSGNLKPFKEKIFKSNINTKIKKIFKKEGDSVKKKTLLASLDNSSIQKRLKKLKIDLKKAKFNVKKARVNYKNAKSTLKISKKNLKLAKSNLNSSKTDPIVSIYNQKSGLLDRSPSAQATILADRKKKKKMREANIQKALKTYEEKKNKYSIALKEKESKSMDLENLNLNLKDKQLDVKFAQKELKDCKIYSDFDATIKKIYRKKDDLLLINDNILRIADLSKLILETDLPRSIRETVNLNSKIEVNVDGKNYIGNISFISSLLDENGKTFKMKISLDNKKSLLYSGLIASVNLKEKTPQKRLVVSSNTIHYENGSEYIFVIKNSVVKKINVKIIKKIDEKFAIEAKDINENDLVVIGVEQKFNNNQKVKVVDSNLTFAPKTK